MMPAMPRTPLQLHHLRQYALARSLFSPTTLPGAIQRLGFVQADPLRAPARAQDLILRHRVKGYRAGDLEARYPKLDVVEDFFVNHGFMPSALHQLMHPRQPQRAWTAERAGMAQQVLTFVQAQGVVRPAQVDAQFAHGSERNWFGGTSKVSTQLLDEMHHRGLLRVARREGGQRLYAVRTPQDHGLEADAVLDALIDVIVGLYAPLPSASLGQLVGLLAGGVPQWPEQRKAALQRARQRLPSAEVAGVTWFWPAMENPASQRRTVPDMVRFLAPFDPVVWDRRRFELLWGWAYRFEAYTPAAKRLRGHYALPLLWRDQVIGWANLRVEKGVLVPDLGYVGAAPKEPSFHVALEKELHSMGVFLGLASGAT
jgi:uncharacterized protein